MSQLDHTQMKAAAEGAHTPLLRAGQMAVQDERVEPVLLGAGEERRADDRGEPRRHLERPETR
jgi:hypothetical protein